MADGDPLDFSAHYNTPLSPHDEAAFQQWAHQNDRLRDLYDYDVRGWWKSQGGTPDERGHGTDTFKKPNHPTFSDQSAYHGADGWAGGTWGRTPDGRDTFTPGHTNMYSPGELGSYFKEVEPGAELLSAPPAPVSRARGGHLRAGQSAIVGEQGPEAFVPTPEPGPEDKAGLDGNGVEKPEELSDEPNPPPGKDSWGFHLLADMSGCSRAADDEHAVRAFFAELVKVLDMRTMTDVIVVRATGEEGRGITAVQVITTSSITYHEDDDKMAVYLDVFTCKWVDDFERKVLDLVQSTFAPQHIAHKMIYRDAGHNQGPQMTEGAQQAPPAPAPQSPDLSDAIRALTEALQRPAPPVHVHVEAPPVRKTRKKVTTRRDAQGRLVADVEETPEEE